MFDQIVVVRGGGDLGSGLTLRIWRSGFPVIVLEQSMPVAVRRTVCLSEAIYDGRARVEEMEGVLAEVSDVPQVLARRAIPVLVDPDAKSLERLAPFAVVDAIMAKRNTGTVSSMAALTIGLGPGFVPGDDVAATIETNRGPHLGRVLWHRPAEPNTGTPGSVAGETVARVLRAPATGRYEQVREIGSILEMGDVVGHVAGVPVYSPFACLLRGIVRHGLPVSEGMKIGDLDPRRDPELCKLVSDKALAVGGGVLEALLSTLL